MRSDRNPYFAARLSTYLGVLFALQFLATSACADDWTTYKHDNALTGRSSATFDPLLLAKAYQKQEDYISRTYTPIVVGESLYAFHDATTNTLRSYNVRNGATQWSTTFEADIKHSSLTYTEGLLMYVGQKSRQPTGSDSFLYVVDATTGAQKYSVKLPVNFLPDRQVGPTVARNSLNQLVAYYTASNDIVALNLGETSGTTLWQSSWDKGNNGLLSLGGNSVFMATGTQYYAFDQLTGAVNRFFSGNSVGAQEIGVAFDSSRMQLYVKDPISGFLTAYTYSSNNVINQLWQSPSIYGGAYGSGPSIGANGRIYSTTRDNALYELDPVDGHVLRSITGIKPVIDAVPVLSANALFLDVDGQTSSGDATNIYDLNTFSLIKTLSRPNGGGPISPGTIFGFGYVVRISDSTSSSRWDIYLAVPEPSVALLLSLGVIISATLRHRRAN